MEAKRILVLIVLKNLTKSYDGTKNAVDNLTMTIEQGEIFGFLGPNGAGKTTTIKMITGVLAPTAGKITVNGIDLKKSPVAAKMNFTYVPDHPEIFSAITGIDYLNFIADMYEVSVRERKKKIEEFAGTFNIYDNLTQTVNSYSHGMKQKLLITGALLPTPKIFILDEPLTGLDPHSAKLLKDIMRDHCDRGGTVFFSSHVLAVVEGLCDRIGIIHVGKLIACDTVAKIKENSSGNLEEIFLEMTANE